MSKEEFTQLLPMLLVLAIPGPFIFAWHILNQNKKLPNYSYKFSPSEIEITKEVNHRKVVKKIPLKKIQRINIYYDGPADRCQLLLDVSKDKKFKLGKEDRWLILLSYFQNSIRAPQRIKDFSRSLVFRNFPVKLAEEIQFAHPAQILKSGELVAFPTETVYGLGADAFNESAIQKIYEAKGRPSSNPLIVHIADLADLSLLAERLDPLEEKLIAAFWPGPLTLVLPKKNTVSNALTGGLPTVAVRMPAHPLALELIKMAGTPIAAPSANPSGKPSATHHEHVQHYFGDRIFTLEGGPTQQGLESTVLQVKNGIPHIYRLGSITPEDIQSATDISPVLETSSPHSPGTRFKHYAPQTPLQILSKKNWESSIAAALERGEKVGVLATTENAKNLPHQNLTLYPLGSEHHLLELASKLYSGLIALDQANLNIIFVQEVPKSGLGLAIMDRLERAACG